MRSSATRSGLALACAGSVLAAADSTVLDIGSRRELFADRLLVDRLDGCRLTLHAPHPADVALRFDAPWEGPFCGYPTVLRTGSGYRLYYRGNPKAGKDGSETEVTCCAESPDGRTWTKPALGLFEVHGTRSNNVVLAGQSPFSHNFAPFVDDRPGVPPDERFKAFAGTSTSGLHGFVSADGLRWRKAGNGPLVRKGAFDSQNVGFWSASENCYVLYLRTWTAGEFAGFRTVSRATSTNFLDWSDPVPMGFGETPVEHLYTTQTHPYFRAPHLYVAFPMRFIPGRRVLSESQALALGVDRNYAGDAAETAFMTSRGGTTYDRTFMEGFIRPGPDPGNWASRAGLAASGMIQTGPAEMSLYKQAHYAQPDAHLVRYVLRLDGFASVQAPYAGGGFTTRPLRFTGRRLVANLATGASGSVRAEIQDAEGRPLPGFTLDDSVEQAGDEIARTLSWKAGNDLSTLAGRPVRLRFVMRDANLYSIQFTQPGPGGGH